MVLGDVRKAPTAAAQSSGGGSAAPLWSTMHSTEAMVLESSSPECSRPVISIPRVSHIAVSEVEPKVGRPVAAFQHL